MIDVVTEVSNPRRPPDVMLKSSNLNDPCRVAEADQGLLAGETNGPQNRGSETTWVQPHTSSVDVSKLPDKMRSGRQEAFWYTRIPLHAECRSSDNHDAP